MGWSRVGHQWNKQLYEVLTGLEFVWAFANDCLYVLYQNNKILLVYVDDMAIVGSNFCQIISLKNDLLAILRLLMLVNSIIFLVSRLLMTTYPNDLPWLISLYLASHFVI